VPYIALTWLTSLAMILLLIVFGGKGTPITSLL
jgi:hypothetical protein